MANSTVVTQTQLAVTHVLKSPPLKPPPMPILNCWVNVSCRDLVRQDIDSHIEKGSRQTNYTKTIILNQDLVRQDIDSMPYCSMCCALVPRPASPPPDSSPSSQGRDKRGFRRRATDSLRVDINCLKWARCHVWPTKVRHRGNCGTSATAPFVLTPSGSCQLFARVPAGIPETWRVSFSRVRHASAYVSPSRYFYVCVFCFGLCGTWAGFGFNYWCVYQMCLFRPVCHITNMNLSLSLSIYIYIISYMYYVCIYIYIYTNIYNATHIYIYIYIYIVMHAYISMISMCSRTTRELCMLMYNAYELQPWSIA